MVPYILQGSHPKGSKLASVQKCVRTTDIDDIGDKTHGTFFEMLGNWSIGDYFKENAIQWSFELLTSHEEGFGLDIDRLYVTVFAGDDNVSRDTDSVDFWKKTGIPENRIYFLGKDNFWSAGESGPSGPSTEMFYDLTEEGLGDLTQEQFEKADESQKVVEIWNDVFMEYLKKDGEIVGKLSNRNVDTGSGLERLLMVLQKKDSIFETDLFAPVMDCAKTLTNNVRSQRILSDHIRTATFMIADGVRPSNTDKGYVLRRLLRRAIFHTVNKTLTTGDITALTGAVSGIYSQQYPDITAQIVIICSEIEKEVEKFSKTIALGIKQLEKLGKHISGTDAFILFTTYGFPIEMTEEIATEKGIIVDRESFDGELKKHQEQSRTASAGKFKGGLGGNSEQITKLHTAHHLLLAGLQQVLGKEVKQKGSNITDERLRLDFSFDRKLTDEEKSQVEKFVNDRIKEGHKVIRKEMPKEEAEKLGAEMEFGTKYADIVSVYSIEDENGVVYSQEFCGGPHVENTKDLGVFRIKKQESSSAGVRRIKAILE